MNSLRIKDKDVYRIEVNDAGEYIEFDLLDINLPYRIYHAIDEIEKLMNDLQTKDCSNFTVDNMQIYENETFLKMRNILDSVLGEGACQKIFGDRNYYEMFYDFFEEMSIPREELDGKSHLDMLNFTVQGIQDRISRKYRKKKSNVL